MKCPGAYSNYDPVTRKYVVNICHFSTYGFFFQSAPVAIIDTPPAVQWVNNGDGVVVVVNGTTSHDTDTTDPVSFAWTIDSAPAG